MELHRTATELHVIEKAKDNLIVSAFVLGAGLVLLVLIPVTQKPLPFVFGGVFFTAIGGLLFFTSEVTTTRLVAADRDAVTITYQRRFGGRRWVRRIHRSDLSELTLDISHKSSTIAVKAKWGEHIGLAHRIGPPDRTTGIKAEAAEIAEYLNVPLNVVLPESTKDVLAALRNQKGHHQIPDRMAPLFGRPTQAELDEQYKRIPDGPPLG